MMRDDKYIFPKQFMHWRFSTPMQTGSLLKNGLNIAKQQKQMQSLFLKLQCYTKSRKRRLLLTTKQVYQPHFKFRHSSAIDNLKIICQQGAQRFLITVGSSKEIIASLLEQGKSLIALAIQNFFFEESPIALNQIQIGCIRWQKDQFGFESDKYLVMAESENSGPFHNCAACWLQSMP